MSVGRFPLSALLRLRTMEQDQAAGALAAATAELANRANAVQASHAALVGHQLSGGHPSAWAASLAERDALELAVTRTVGAHEEAGRAVETATSGWRAARVRARALEKLEGKHLQAQRRQAWKASQQLVDEAASRPRAAAQAP